MTFIKYTSDGKAVIQPAALTLSGLDREETLELHTLENAIVLLKQEMEPAEKAAATTTLLRLAHSLMEDMLADWEAQEDDGDMCDGCHGCDEDMLPIPAEAFADAGILYDNLCVFSVDGAVLVVSDDHKTTWVALSASSMRSFFSFISVSVAAPTLITATPPASFARRS